MNLAEQQHAIITHLPTTLGRLRAYMHDEFGLQLGSVVANRLASGDKVFGHRMFTMSSGELYHEAMEELADAVLYYAASQWVGENGPIDA